jgi:hypothetical protein
VGIKPNTLLKPTFCGLFSTLQKACFW